MSNERPLVLGTAGHIDHGKTLLVKALTGTDTDRLAEEKKRGISIELGFAHFDLPSGQGLAVVDVPGHEKFVRNMVAGASGLDLVMLVVAADDGVMPQTREHLAILDLLGIRDGVVAITKADTVDEDWLELVREDVKQLIEGTVLEGARIVPVSAKTGQGLDDLRLALDEVVSKLKERRDDAPARLPVDRVFSMSGSGTVVTGTLWSGEIKPDQLVVVQPSGKQARVRSVQVHGEKSDAVAGQRVALNLVGLAKNEIDRGNVVTAPGFLSPTYMVDVHFRLLKGAKELKERTRVRFHHGTKEALGRIIFFDRATLKPGESAFAQMRLEEPIVPRFGDRFVVRSYSPIETIGGGIVIESHPSKHKRSEQDLFEVFGKKLAGKPEELVELALAGNGLVSVPDLAIKTEFSPSVLEKAIGNLSTENKLVETKLDRVYYSLASEVREKEEAVAGHLAAFYKENPLDRGIPKQRLKAELFREMSDREFDVLLARLVSQDRIALDGTAVVDPSKQLVLSDEDQAMIGRIENRLKDAGCSPPEISTLAEELGVNEKKLMSFIEILARDKKVVKVSPEFYFDGSTIEDAKVRMRETFAGREISVSEFRQLLETSRKYALPLLNYFDATGVTRRQGDARTLR